MNRNLVYVLVSIVLVACDESTPPAPSHESPALEVAPVDALTTPMGSLLDPEIFAIVAPAELDRIAGDLQALVGFGTRNTCSDNGGATPGIGAARDWI